MVADRAVGRALRYLTVIAMFWWYFERIAKYIILALVATPFVAAFAYLLDTAEGSNNADRARVERRIAKLPAARQVRRPAVQLPIGPPLPRRGYFGNLYV